MRALTRKLLRDLKGLRGPAVATSLVVAAGLSVFVMSLSTLHSLQRTQADYYLAQRFADVFVRLERAPDALAARLAEIPGVAAVEPRVVAEARLDVQSLPEPAVGRLISLPPPGSTALNRVHVRRGRLPEPGRPGEALVSEAFADAHRLEPGAVLTAVVEGRARRLTVVGVGLSPEFVYSLPPGQLLPDDRRFGVFWMDRDDLAESSGFEGAFNDACLALTPGAVEPAVLEALDRLTEPYGGLGAYGRDEQPSHQYLDGEIQQLRGMALVAPLIFLFVAAFLLHVALARFIGTQREQIAALKAFGYRDGEVARHFLGLATLMVAPGIVLGVAAGAWLGLDLTRVYTRFFRFPVLDYALGADVVFLGAGVAVAAAVGGTLGAVRRVVRLTPAAAMQPEAPLRYSRSWLERLGLAWLLGPVGSMVLRHMARRPVRTLLSGVGIALATSVVVMGGFIEDVLDEVVDCTFFRTQRQDVSVHLVQAMPGARAALAALPGVTTVEPFRSVAARVRHGHLAERVGLLGLEADARLRRPEAGDDRPLALPEDGIVLSRPLAEALGARPGDLVWLEALEGRRPASSWVVRDVSRDYAGLAAYAALPALQRWLGEQGVVSGASLAVDATRIEDLQARLREAPNVGVIALRSAGLQTFEETVAESLLRMKLINVVFASILAVGVVYNAARVSLAERSRDLATLRILGYTRGEISTVLLGELAVLTLVAVPLGLVLGRFLSAAVLTAVETEAYRFPLVIQPPTYAFAAVVTVAACLGSALLVRRRLDRLDLVAVLKARE